MPNPTLPARELVSYHHAAGTVNSYHIVVAADQTLIVAGIGGNNPATYILGPDAYDIPITTPAYGSEDRMALTLKTWDAGANPTNDPHGFHATDSHMFVLQAYAYA